MVTIGIARKLALNGLNRKAHRRSNRQPRNAPLRRPACGPIAENLLGVGRTPLYILPPDLWGIGADVARRNVDMHPRLAGKNSARQPTTSRHCAASSAASAPT